MNDNMSEGDRRALAARNRTLESETARADAAETALQHDRALLREATRSRDQWHARSQVVEGHCIDLREKLAALRADNEDTRRERDHARDALAAERRIIAELRERLRKAFEWDHYHDATCPPNCAKGQYDGEDPQAETNPDAERLHGTEDEVRDTPTWMPGDLARLDVDYRFVEERWRVVDVYGDGASVYRVGDDLPAKVPIERLRRPALAVGGWVRHDTERWTGRVLGLVHPIADVLRAEHGPCCFDAHRLIPVAPPEGAESAA